MGRWTQGLGALALALGLTVAPPVQAASLVARDVAYMTLHADAVVRGAVVDQRVELDADDMPWTVTTLSVEQAYKGKVGATVEVWQRGGEAPDGTILKIDGDLELAVGERAVVFLARDPDLGGRFVSFLLGWSAFEIDGDGAMATLRRSAHDLHGWVLGSDGVLARPGKALHTKPPIVLSDLETRIASALEGDR